MNIMNSDILLGSPTKKSCSHAQTNSKITDTKSKPQYSKFDFIGFEGTKSMVVETLQDNMHLLI